MGNKMDEILAETFSRRLYTARKIRQLTQEQLGQMCNGMHPSMVCFLESGRRHPMVETVYRLALALEVSVDYLLGLSDDMGSVGVPRETYDHVLKENESLRSFIREAVKEKASVG